MGMTERKPVKAIPTRRRTTSKDTGRVLPGSKKAQSPPLREQEPCENGRCSTAEVPTGAFHNYQGTDGAKRKRGTLRTRCATGNLNNRPSDPRRRVQPDAAPNSHRRGNPQWKLQAVYHPQSFTPGTACRTNAGAGRSLSPASSALAGRGYFSHLRGNRTIGIHRDVKGEVYVEVRSRPVADCVPSLEDALPVRRYFVHHDLAFSLCISVSAARLAVDGLGKLPYHLAASSPAW